MLKFLSKVKIEFNALDPRTASCMEFLAQCNTRKAKESNLGCQLQVKRRTDDHPPQITINGVEEMFDATATPAQSIRTMILDKGQMFRDAGEKWPVRRRAPSIVPWYQGSYTLIELNFILMFMGISSVVVGLIYSLI